MQIVESIRDGNKVRQRIVRHLGTAREGDDLDRLIRTAEFLKARDEERIQPSLFSQEEIVDQLTACRRRREERKKKEKEKDQAPLNVDLRQLEEVHRLTAGIHDLYGALYHELGLSSILPSYRYRASSRALLHLVMARIANPKSKRASARMLEEEFGVGMPLQKIYRMMDL